MIVLLMLAYGMMYLLKVCYRLYRSTTAWRSGRHLWETDFLPIDKRLPRTWFMATILLPILIVALPKPGNGALVVLGIGGELLFLTLCVPLWLFFRRRARRT